MAAEERFLPLAKIPNRNGNLQRSRHLSESDKNRVRITDGTMKRKVSTPTSSTKPQQTALPTPPRLRHASDSTGGNRIRRKRVAVAPGQGQIPVPIWKYPDVEEKSFPGLHPLGSNGPKVPRKAKLTLGEYVKNRLSNVDRRFAKCVPWMFLNLFRIQTERLLSSINVSLKKSQVWEFFHELFCFMTFFKFAGGKPVRGTNQRCLLHSSLSDSRS